MDVVARDPGDVVYPGPYGVLYMPREAVDLVLTIEGELLSGTGR
jgi:hypothetical protein